MQPYNNLEIEPNRLPRGSNTLFAGELTVPTPTKPIQPFLVTTHLVADALVSQSIKLPAFCVQIRHLSLQALNLAVRLNNTVNIEETATEEQYEQGFDLDR